MLADALGIGHTKLDTGLLSMLHLVFVCSTSTLKTDERNRRKYYV